MALIESGKEFDKGANHDKLAKLAADTQQYTLRIPAHLYKQVKLKLVKENQKLRPVLIRMLMEYIKT
jgi:hypothetical protein